MQVIISEVIEGLRSAIQSRADIGTNPMNIVGIGMGLLNKYPTLTGAEKRSLLVEALTKIASGPDGVLGTADDTIPKPIVDTILSLIEGNLINGIIGLVVDATKGRFDVDKAVEVAKEASKTCSGCFSFVISKIKAFKSKKKSQ